MNSKSKKISPILRSNQLIETTMEKYHQPVKQIVDRHIREGPRIKTYMEDTLNGFLVLNPFRDLSKPFKSPLDLPEDLIQKALGEEILETREKLKAARSSQVLPKSE